MIGFLADVEFLWGFQARAIGLSRTPPSFYYPPPTVFLGALAEVIAKENNIGESLGKFIINELSRNLLAIGFRPINCIPVKYEDLNRIIMIRCVGKKIESPLPTKPYGSFDSPARGKTIFSSLNNEPPRVRWFLVFENRELDVRDERLRSKIDKITLNENYFWKIHRLGSKESKISVIDVTILDNIQIINKGYIITGYAFPLKSVKDGEEKTRKWEYEVYVNPFKGDIYTVKRGKRGTIEESGILDKYYDLRSLLIFKVPIICLSRKLPEYMGTLNDNWKAYSISYGNKREVILGR